MMYSVLVAVAYLIWALVWASFGQAIVLLESSLLKHLESESKIV